MKTWPLLMVCQGTAAVHTEFMHNYGTSAFLLQWNQMAAVSDRGSQLTSGKNNVTFPEKEAAGNWN